MNPILRYMRRNVPKSEPINEVSAKIDLWSSLYENRAPWLSKEVTGLNLASAIASEFARLTTLEMKTEVSGGERGEFLNGIYQNVTAHARNFTELACAKGSVILKPYVRGTGIYVDYIQPNDFLPLDFDGNGNITAAVFCERIYKEDKVFTRLEEHRLDKNYIITNKAYKSNSLSDIGREIPLNSVSEWASLQERAEISGIDKPLFAHFKMPSANVTNPDSPMGTSVYARAVDLIKDADIQYARFLWEFESGKRALFVDESALTRDKLGRKIIPDERLYRMLSTDDDTLFKDWTPTIRQEEINKGLNRILRGIEFNTGLAYGTLSDVQYSDKTAEEIRSSKQRSYATVSDIQMALKTALQDLVYAMNVWCSIYRLAPEGEYDICFDFDDSIIADRALEFNEKKQLVEIGIMKPWEFRMWYFGEEEETARKNSGYSEEEKND